MKAGIRAIAALGLLMGHVRRHVEEVARTGLVQKFQKETPTGELLHQLVNPV